MKASSKTELDSLPPIQNKPAPSVFYFSVWRWHFYAGLYVVPFVIILALTGLTMMVSELIQPRGYGGVVTVQGRALTASEQVALVQSHYPEAQVLKYYTPEDSDLPAYADIKIKQANEDLTLTIAIDPYSGALLSENDLTRSVKAWANDIHGTILLGDVGDIMIEIAAGFAIILVVTGLYLVWPRQGDGKGWRAVLLPDLRGRGRAFWKRLHGTLGFYLGIFLVLFMLSGLAWTGVWGSKLVQAWSTFPAAKWEAPLSEKLHIHRNTEPFEDVPWALEQTPLPASTAQQGIDKPATLDMMVALGQSHGMTGRFTIDLPQDETDVYSISEDSMSGDSPNPIGDQVLHVDQYSAKVLGHVRFDDYSLGGKAMAVGIALHEGKVGLASIIANIVLTLSFIFIAISGIVMWWKRRPKMSARLASPPKPIGSRWSVVLYIILGMSILFPLSGLALVAVLIFDQLICRWAPTLYRRLS